MNRADRRQLARNVRITTDWKSDMAPEKRQALLEFLFGTAARAQWEQGRAK